MNREENETEGENESEHDDLGDEEDEEDEEETDLRHCRGCGLIIASEEGYVVCNSSGCGNVFHVDCHETSFTDGRFGRKHFICKTCLRIGM